MMGHIVRNKLVETLGRLWPFMKQEKRGFTHAALATLGLTAVEVAAPILLGVFVDSLLAEISGRSFAVSWGLGRREIVGLLALAAIVGGYFLYKQNALAGKIGEKVSARIRSTLWESLQKLPLDYTRRRGPGRLLLRLNGDTRAVERFISEGVVRVSQDVLLLAAILAALLFLNLRMGLAVLVMLPLFAVIFGLVNPRLQKASRDTRKRRSRLSGYLNARIAGMEVVKSRGARQAESRRIRKMNRGVAKHGTRLAAADGRLQGLSMATLSIAAALVLWLAAGEVTSGRLTGGQLVAFNSLLGLLTPIVRRITIADRYFQEAQISVERLHHTFSETPEHLSDELPPLKAGEGVVSLEGISFAYDDGTAALEDANLRARRGEFVALTGANGSGKSTLLELIPLFRKPSSGRILIDGQEVRDVSLGSIRAQVGLVEQDAVMFEGTVWDNVAYGLPSDISEERILRAARFAGMEDFVEELSDGWKTKLREGKRELSQGQRQRVALARALAADPPILVLDEPTATLDTGAANHAVQTMRELAGEKTIIAATSDPAMLVAADRIYTLDHGYASETELETLQARAEARSH